MSNEPSIRIVVADDHPVVRNGLVALLRSIPGLDVVGEAADGDLPVIRIGRCLRVPVKLIAELIEDADAFVERERTELQPINDPAAT